MKYIRDFSKSPRYWPTATSDISGGILFQVCSYFENGLSPNDMFNIIEEEVIDEY